MGPPRDVVAWLELGPGGNHVAKVRKACEGLTGVVLVDVRHDDWCDLLKYGCACNCDPDVNLLQDKPC